VLNSGSGEFELSDHVFVALEDVLEHAEVGVDGVGLWGGGIVVGLAVDCQQLGFVYFGVHCLLGLYLLWSKYVGGCYVTLGLFAKTKLIGG
jgi:hypothetical protein